MIDHWYPFIQSANFHGAFAICVPSDFNKYEMLKNTDSDHPSALNFNPGNDPDMMIPTTVDPIPRPSSAQQSMSYYFEFMKKNIT